MKKAEREARSRLNIFSVQASSDRVVFRRKRTGKEIKKKGEGRLLRQQKGSLPLEHLEQFQFEMLRISNHTACRFVEKARFFRSLRAGRRCAVALRFIFFKVET